jgi:hypothetical protein
MPKDKADTSISHNAVQLPTEIMDHIISFLKADDDLPALAAVAQVNHDMYNLAIPKLYESVTINKDNKEHIKYGHSSLPLEPPNGTSIFIESFGKKLIYLDTEAIERTPTRKDIAVSYTRKLVFDGPPDFVISKHYRAVEEVVFFAPCLHDVIKHGRDNSAQALAPMLKCLGQLVRRYLTSGPLHLTVRPRNQEQSPCDAAMKLLFSDGQPVPITCDFYGMSMDNHDVPFNLAYDLGAIVHFSEEAPLNGEAANDIAFQLADIVDDLFDYEENQLYGSPPGQIFFCDVSRLILSPKELAACENANDAARLKLFDLCDFDRFDRKFTASQSWEYFTSRVKLVDPGFKPSQADMLQV